MTKSKAGHEYLITYQNAVAIFDLTQHFCEKFVNPRSHTFDQMVQVFDSEGQSPQAQTRRAARSSKQCIPEGYLPKSLKGYLKLLGVTRGSFEELLQDLLDFARNRGVNIRDKWDKGVKRDKFGKYLFPLNPLSPLDPFIPVNVLINLIRRTNYLLDRQIKALEAKFIREGGYTENLFKKRLAFRNKI